MENKPPDEIQKGIVIPHKIKPIKLLKESKKNLSQADIKRRRFIKEYIKNDNATLAYMIAYKVSKETARGNASNLLKEIDISDIMEIKGITDNKLLQGIDEGLKADKPFGKDAFIYPDYQTRLGYITTGLKLKKRLNDTKQDTNNNMVGLNIIINK